MALTPIALIPQIEQPAEHGGPLIDMHGLDDVERTGVARQLPLGFVSLPEDHASLYVLLAARAESRFITGAVIPCDGGLEVRGGGRGKRTIADPAQAGAT